MSTTTDRLPMRPRGAARHAANAPATRRAQRAAERAAADPTTVTGTGSVTHSTTGVAVSPPAAPASTSAESLQPLPSRRTLRAGRPAIRPVAFGRAVTRTITLPLRSIGSAVASARAVPLTATAVAACLFVTVVTPQTATAASATSVLPALDVQEYTTSATSTARAERDGFAIGRAPERRAAAAPTSEAAPGASNARPVAGTIPAAGGFGSRWVSGCGACSTNHQGLDFAAREGTAVVAAMSGRVVSAGVVGGYGNQVLLQHTDGSQTRYGHLSQIGVRVGKTVTAGQRIGAVGNTGVSTGSHLHFEVLHGGVAVDPAVWLRDRGLL
ncbi:M23 family metallopeptidase [Curtobacterium sp. SORGH_AS_0776]|uniref:M23 family metallopeptidase n=1 Tax=Curtobacterium sp. SORGH_AS_0776 TaxID=3041798 RepID=UPI0028571B02|nr:M23 family metallopeptidase [Curtobacterium sp. SORGH_AS_0776]MDR6170339.1 murein DD-endopeptidase MepM/ murein hydrolase activator NlpD [Curtobacterium sp. SORGH_AS_0776]